MRKVTDIFREKQRTFSFEVFPPKTDKGMDSLRETLKRMERLPFDYASVTYGAGGSSRDRTFAIARELQEEHGLPALHHFTCVAHSKDEVGSILDSIKACGIFNVLALRGDPPKDDPAWKPGPEHFKYSSELVEFIKSRYDGTFAVGVAGFPEAHPLAPSRDFDADVLKRKIDAGGDFVVTQLFFDNRDYFAYVERARSRGVAVRIIPGILPITSYEGAVKFCAGCGASVPREVHDIFRPIAEDKDRTLEAGIAYAVRQCRELLDRGAPGIHFYALNKSEPVGAILRELQTGR
jgi:methylenetetrahydrofolate reductase (NADPH)